MAMSMNLTLQKYRTEQATILKTNENRERALEELGQRTNDIENRQVTQLKVSKKLNNKLRTFCCIVSLYRSKSVKLWNSTLSIYQVV